MSILHEIAIKHIGHNDKWIFAGVDWWPSLITSTADEYRVVRATMLPLGMHIAPFLKELDEVPDHKWLNHAAKLLVEYCYDYKNQELLAEALAYILGSSRHSLEDMKEWMAKRGYDFGEYSDL